jgi:dihydropteroate synthase
LLSHTENNSSILADVSADKALVRARVMGIVNVTPDSFSDGGLFLDPGRAIEHGRQLVAEGADILDVGGESTRPGAESVPAGVELARTAPVVAALAIDGGVPVSIDTSKAEVARAALEAGARIVNDVTALRADPELAAVCAERDCELVLMHMQGSPRTMQDAPTYDDVVDDVRAFLAQRIAAAVAAGVAEERIWVDPGIGFGKTAEHNVELLRRLGDLRELGRPIVIGTSRKRFLGVLTGRGVGDRLGGTVASNVLALAAGADVFRVHDVLAVRQALEVAEAILGRREWRRPAGAR